MSKRKGMSLEDKRDKLLELFHDSSDVFVLKDIEKMGMKKGIVLQTIKEVLQSLVDDDLVHQEKIGASNYFWAFPAEASTKIENELKAQQSKLSDFKRRRVELETRLTEEKNNKADSAGKAEKLAGMRALEKKVAALRDEASKYADNDPATAEAFKQAIHASKASANRWLDNIYSLQDWCKKQFAGRESELSSFFEQCGYSDSMEYIE